MSVKPTKNQPARSNQIFILTRYNVRVTLRVRIDRLVGTVVTTRVHLDVLVFVKTE